MSAHRKPGDRVWVREGAAFGAGGRWATIMTGGDTDEATGVWYAWNQLDEDERSIDSCMVCDDPECREWPNLEADEGGCLYHVSECQMFDAPPAQKDVTE